ncbi:MAG: hypothetical protein J7I99_02370 [Methanophagales archaeon]|nr:hypothetical protein [Methanophagales archaeon]
MSEEVRQRLLLLMALDDEAGIYASLMAHSAVVYPLSGAYTHSCMGNSHPPRIMHLISLHRTP